ncbi:MAG: hypothetical protein KDC38_18580, partial [Planctomycetes bacterium]|nr:hypothetical protein [Planctomycetota bacterium]
MTAPSLPDTILTLLQSSSIALSRHAIAARCRGSQAYDVARALSELKARGLVDQDRGGRWRVTAPTFERHEDAPAPTPKPSRAVESRGTRWDEFRRLCRYYAECVRNSERPLTKYRLAKRGEEYFEVSPAPDLRRLAAGKSVSVPIAADSRRFAERLRKRRKDSRVTIGTPVVADRELVMPLLTIEADASFSGGRLRLDPVAAVTHNPAATRL